MGEVGIKNRLRKGGNLPLLKLNEQSGSGRLCCDKFRGSGEKSGGEPSSSSLAETRGGYRNAELLLGLPKNDFSSPNEELLMLIFFVFFCNNAVIARCRSCRQSGSPGPSNSSSSTSQIFTTQQQHNNSGPREARRSQEKWILAPRSPEKRLSLGSGRQSISKSREILSIIEENGEAAAAAAAAAAAVEAAELVHSPAHQGIMTRARKRKLLDLAAAESSAAAEAVIKRSKMDGKQALAKGGADRQLRGTTNRRSSKGGKSSSSCGGVEAAAAERGGQDSEGVVVRGGEEEAVIPHEQWLRERDERDFKYPPTICNKAPVSVDISWKVVQSWLDWKLNMILRKTGSTYSCEIPVPLVPYRYV